MTKSLRYMLILTEVIVLKAVVIIDTRLVGRINDDFWGYVVLLFNIGLSFLCNLGRYFLGAIDNQWEVNLLSGKMKPFQHAAITSSYYWRIHNYLCFGLGLASSIIIVGKKVMVYHREKNTIQHIIPFNTFNTSKYNMSVLNILAIIFLMFACYVIVQLTIYLSKLDLDDKITYYTLRFYLKLGAVRLFFRLIIPIIVLSCNPDMRKYMWRELKRLG